MPAFNIVRFRVKPGREDEFVSRHREMPMDDAAGLHRFVLIDTGNGTYSVVGEWESFGHLAAARPMMIGMLDEFREMLEDLGNEMGVTDPVSGEAVVMTEGPAAKRAAPKRKAPRKAARKAKPAAKKKAAAKKPAKKPAKKAPAKKAAKKRGRR